MFQRSIYELRLHLGMTREQFAHEIGTTHMTVFRWEKGSSVPSPIFKRELERLAKKNKFDSLDLSGTAQESQELQKRRGKVMNEFYNEAPE